MPPKLARSFRLVLSTTRSKYVQQSDAPLADLLRALAGKDARKVASAFLWVDGKAERHRVEDDHQYQGFIGAMREKLLGRLSADETARLEALEAAQRAAELPHKEAAELEKLTTAEQDIIAIIVDAEEPAGGDDGLSEPERLRLDRMRRAAERAEAAAAERAKEPAATVSLVALRFPHEKDARGHVIEVTLPYLAAWEQLCDAMRARFRRICHFRYQTDKKAWFDVRSPAAWGVFKEVMGHEWAAQNSTTGAAEVQLVPFGTGALPLLDSLEDHLILGSAHDVIKGRMKLMPLLSLAATNEAGAAERARALVQSKEAVAECAGEHDDAGRSVLHMAAMGGHALLAEAILSASSAERAALACATDMLGRTPLHYARTEACALALLGGKADPRAHDRAGRTPLHTATDPDVAAVLLRGKSHGGAADAAVNAPDAAGMTPLLAHAVHSASLDMLTWLVDKCNGVLNSDNNPVHLDMRAKDNCGRTALHHAAMANNWTGLQCLVKSGQVDLNAKDKYGMTPLHYASRADHLRSVSYLVGQQANVALRDGTGKTPSELAQGNATKRLLTMDAGILVTRQREQ